ncbi:MAG: polyamine aminopropyltransferase [Gammaproteobacteria bacterium]
MSYIATKIKLPYFKDDLLLIISMAILAACGLIYEYLLAHYAGRILGAVETTIYAMIGIMIVAMGIGAFTAKWIKNPFTGFTWLEVTIALLGSSSILIMATMTALIYTLPHWLHELYDIHPSVLLQGGAIETLKEISFYTPYITGFILGLMIGMEIPLIARVRETIHQQHLVHNTGTIYGADYIGAGIGAAIWVTVCLQIPIMVAAVATAAANILVGIIFLIRYRKRINKLPALIIAHLVVTGVIIILAFSGAKWLEQMNYALFEDEPVYTKVTPYQHLTITQRIVGQGLDKVTSLYINGRLQFSSSDEHIYHSLLTYPALLTSARHDKILVIGGGDGLAVRDILKWNPKSITLIDLDTDMVNLFRGNDSDLPDKIKTTLLTLNENSLNDSRVTIINNDAFLEVEKLVSQQQHFDTIIVDLPDPSHPDLNKLYSDFFYARLKELLSGDGVIAIQSTSPYHAQQAFISIGKTLRSVGFKTEQYHANVPTFGEWGWTIGTVHGQMASQRIANSATLPVTDPWISKEQLLAAFVFAPSFYQFADDVMVNKLGSRVIYNYHQAAWGKLDGVFYSNPAQQHE